MKTTVRSVVLAICMAVNVAAAQSDVERSSTPSPRTMAKSPATKTATGGPNAAGTAKQPGKERTGKAVAQRAREGEQLVDAVGTFARVGDRLQIELPDGRQFILLENLVLDRVVDAMRKSDQAATWQIRGTITEFAGKNFLMLTQAVRKTSPVPGIR